MLCLVVKKTGRTSKTSKKAKRSVRTVAARDAIKAQAANTGVFIDVRHPTFAKEMTPAGFRQIPYYSIKEIRKGDLPTDQPLYLAGAWGLTDCEEAARALEKKGFKEIHVITGGVVSWGSCSGPVSSCRNLAEMEKKYNCRLNMVE